MNSCQTVEPYVKVICTCTYCKFCITYDAVDEADDTGLKFCDSSISVDKDIHDL